MTAGRPRGQRTTTRTAPRGGRPSCASIVAASSTASGYPQSLPPMPWTTIAVSPGNTQPHRRAYQTIVALECGDLGALGAEVTAHLEVLLDGPDVERRDHGQHADRHQPADGDLARDRS